MLHDNCTSPCNLKHTIMFEKIMGMVKEQVMHSIDNVPGIPEEKKEQTIETTASSLVDGLKNHAAGGGLSGITSLLGIGKSASTSASGASTGGLESGVVSALTSKVGISPAVAKSVVAAVIPAVMSLFKKKIDDPDEPGFNLESLIGGLTGGKSGGILSALGGLFGKKG